MLMLIAITALPAGHVFFFKGGSSSEFAGAVAAYTHEPVAVLVHAPSPLEPRADPTWPLMRVEHKSMEDFAEALHRKLQLDPAKEPYALAPAAWPASNYFTQNRPLGPAERKSTNPEVTVAWGDGKVTIKTAGSGMPLSDLLSASKLCARAAWFYDDVKIACFIENLDPDRALSLICSAAGAKVENTDSGPRTVFDPAAYRRRGLARLALEMGAASLASRRADCAYTREVLRTLSEPAIAECLATPSGVAELQVAEDSPLIGLASKRLQTTYPVNGDSNGYDEAQVKTWSLMKDWAHWERIYKAEFLASGWSSAVYKGKTEHGDCHI
jgi:hypothetical protein